jgi:flagellar biosynthesis anti-sigma factor FlgM
MKSRSTKPPRGMQDRKTGSVTAIPITSSKKNRNIAKTTLESELHPEKLAKLQTRISQLPDMDAAKIVDLHERIISGEYKIDSELLAENLQKFEADL